MVGPALPRLDQTPSSISPASDEVPGEAVFWLAETRPERGIEAARALARDGSASRKVRENEGGLRSLADQDHGLHR